MVGGGLVYVTSVLSSLFVGKHEFTVKAPSTRMRLSLHVLLVGLVASTTAFSLPMCPTRYVGAAAPHCKQRTVGSVRLNESELEATDQLQKTLPLSAPEDNAPEDARTEMKRIKRRNEISFVCIVTAFYGLVFSGVIDLTPADQLATTVGR